MAAFGNTYCAISHLEIKDGDKCILIPLGFRMNYEFSNGEKADINCFTYLHSFIGESVEVKFGGNASTVFYANKGEYHKKGDEYDEHELFMLIHEGFYSQIIQNVERWDIEHLESVPLFNTVYPIWEKAKELKDGEYKMVQLIQKKITQKEFDAKTPCPEWMKNIYKVAIFMGDMGIAPHPVFCNDQRNRGEDYEKFRTECLKPKKAIKK